MKRLAVYVTTGIVLALASIQLYTRYGVACNNFFFRASYLSDAWEQQLRKPQDGKPVYILAGGSEARSGIDPAILQDEYGIPLVNAALSAGYGLAGNTATAARYLKPGDTLLLSLLSTADINIPPSSEGIKMAAYLAGYRAFSCGIIQLSALNIKKFLASDIIHNAVAINRYFMRSGRLFKYEQQTVLHKSGWMEIQYDTMRQYTPAPFQRPDRLIPIQPGGECETFLQNLSRSCAANHNRLIVMLPVTCSDGQNRAANAMLALQCMRMGIPVLKDERLGCDENAGMFSDMPCHMNKAGAEANSRKLGAALKENAFWTEEELATILGNMGWDSNGTRATRETGRQ